MHGYITTKRDEIESTINSLKYHSEIVDSLNEKLNRLKNSFEIENSELYKKLSKIVTVDIVFGKFKEILGGDGRSQPYDQEKEGKIAIVKIDNTYYLNNKQLEIVKKYIEDTQEVEYVKFEWK